MKISRELLFNKINTLMNYMDMEHFDYEIIITDNYMILLDDNTSPIKVSLSCHTEKIIILTQEFLSILRANTWHEIEIIPKECELDVIIDSIQFKYPLSSNYSWQDYETIVSEYIEDIEITDMYGKKLFKNFYGIMHYYYEKIKNILDDYIYKRTDVNIFVDKLSRILNTNNIFLEAAKTDKKMFHVLYQQLAWHKSFRPRYQAVKEIYNDITVDMIRAIFTVMSLLVTPAEFVAVLCQFYILHTNLICGGKMTKDKAIFNIVLSHKLIEQLFFTILNFSYDKLEYPEQKILPDMNKAMLKFTKNENKLIALNENRPDIFTFDEYMTIAPKSEF